MERHLSKVVLGGRGVRCCMEAVVVKKDIVMVLENAVVFMDDAILWSRYRC